MLQEFDPFNGLKTTIKVEDGELRVNYSQDARPFYERLEKLRNADEYSKQGIKDNLWHAISISVEDCLRLKVEDGIDPWACSAKELRQHLTRNRDKWGHLFATSGRV
jgi:hypothetical protein